MWLANLAALELHTHQWTIDDPGHPTAMVLDLDPGPPAGVLDCAAVALELRDTARPTSTCERVVKTSGGKGLHLSVPLNTVGATRRGDEGVRARARPAPRVARPEARHTSTWPRTATGQVFVDWSQNDSHKTTVCRVLAADPRRGRRSRRR